MALKLFSADNIPQGLNLMVSQAYTPGIFAQYSGWPGICWQYSGDSAKATSDGYLTFQASNANALGGWMSKVSDIRGASATQSWLGFRYKNTVTFMTGPLVFVSATTSGTTQTVLLTMAQVRTAGFGALNEEDYIEVFLDSTNQVYQVWINGVKVLSGSFAANSYPATGAGYVWVACASAGLGAAGAYGIRDVYWMDIDSVDTARLGPIHSVPATIVVTGSEYVVTGAASLQAAVTTALQNPPTATPNALSPADKQPLTATLSTSLGSTIPILAIQGQISAGGTASAPGGVDMSLTDGTHTTDLGVVSLPDATMLYNRYAPNIARTAPDGSAWTVAKVNTMSLLATPQ